MKINIEGEALLSELVDSNNLKLDQKLIEKSKKLTSIFNSVFKNAVYRPEFEYIMNKFYLNEKEILKSFLEYNLDVYYNIGNLIYQKIENRVVLHIHNLVKGSWHTDRQNNIIELIKLAQPKTMTDIGFGVPSGYVKQILNNMIPTVLTLADFYDSAFQFASALLEKWSEDWRKHIKFKKTNMDTEEYIGDLDLYLFQDSIEHALNPTAYLKKYVAQSPVHSLFLLSLPIGPIMPIHNIAWESENEANVWLKSCGLQIEYKKSVFVNPEIDLFAEQLGNTFHDLIVLCKKC